MAHRWAVRVDLYLPSIALQKRPRRKCRGARRKSMERAGASVWVVNADRIWPVLSQNIGWLLTVAS
jgi:hypothetical protein